jgi:hypothetical protein
MFTLYKTKVLVGMPCLGRSLWEDSHASSDSLRVAHDRCKAGKDAVRRMGGVVRKRRKHWRRKRFGTLVGREHKFRVLVVIPFTIPLTVVRRW